MKKSFVRSKTCSPHAPALFITPFRQRGARTPERASQENIEVGMGSACTWAFLAHPIPSFPANKRGALCHYLYAAGQRYLVSSRRMRCASLVYRAISCARRPFCPCRCPLLVSQAVYSAPRRVPDRFRLLGLSMCRTRTSRECSTSICAPECIYPEHSVV